MASGYQVAADVGSTAARLSKLSLPEASAEKPVKVRRAPSPNCSTPGMVAERRSLTANDIDEERLVELPRATLDR